MSIPHVQVRTARSQWLAEEEGGIDDCTAIVCILQQGSRARRTGSMPPLDAAKAATAISRSALTCCTHALFPFRHQGCRHH